MPTKNTNTNNNIIQILLENKKSKRRKTNNRKEQGQQRSVNYIKDNEMQTRPLNLVNSMASSSRLEDQARVRFMDAMRDPFSTKSPYSIYDNGSNTFARQGETVGAEVPISPQLRPDDYFEEPIRQSARQFSSPRRFDIRDDISDISDLSPVGSNSYNSSHISDVSEMSAFPFPLRKVRKESENSFPGIPLYQSTDESKYDDWVDPTQQDDIPAEMSEDNSDKFGISGAQYFQPDQTRFTQIVEPPPAFSTPYRPPTEPNKGGETGETELRYRSQKLGRDMERYEDAINEIDEELKKLDMMNEGGGEIEPATRFSETTEPPPAFATPYRPQAEDERIDKLIEKFDSISSKLGKKQQPEQIIEEEVAEVPPTTIEVVKPLTKNEKRRKIIDEKIKSIVMDLDGYIITEKTEKEIIAPGQKVGRSKKGEIRKKQIIEVPAKVGKDVELRGEIVDLLKNKDFIKFYGKKSIGSLKDAKKLLEFMEKNTGIKAEVEEPSFAKTAGGGAVASRI